MRFSDEPEEEFTSTGWEISDLGEEILQHDPEPTDLLPHFERLRQYLEQKRKEKDLPNVGFPPEFDDDIVVKGAPKGPLDSDMVPHDIPPEEGMGAEDYLRKMGYIDVETLLTETQGLLPEGTLHPPGPEKEIIEVEVGPTGLDLVADDTPGEPYGEDWIEDFEPQDDVDWTQRRPV